MGYFDISIFGHFAPPRGEPQNSILPILEKIPNFKNQEEFGHNLALISHIGHSLDQIGHICDISIFGHFAPPRGGPKNSILAILEKMPNFKNQEEFGHNLALISHIGHSLDQIGHICDMSILVYL